MKNVIDTSFVLVRRAFLSAVLTLWTAPALAVGEDTPVGHGDLPGVEHAAEHGTSGSLPQFDAEWFPSQVFWLAVTFAVLYAFFARRALPAIEQTIAARTAQVETQRAEAADLAKQAQDIRDSYERDMNKAREKSTEILRAVDVKIKEKASDMLYSYRTKYTQEIARTEDELANIRTGLMSAMNTVAADIAAQAASDILATPADVSQAQKIVETLHHQRAA